MRLLLILLMTTTVAMAIPDPFKEMDENSDDVFESAPKVVPSAPGVETSIDSSPSEVAVDSAHQFSRLVPGTFAGEDFNEGSDGFPRMTAMNVEPSVEPPHNETTKVPLDIPLLPLPDLTSSEEHGREEAFLEAVQDRDTAGMDEEKRRNSTKILGMTKDGIPTDERAGLPEEKLKDEEKKGVFPTLMVEVEKGDEQSRTLPVQILELTTSPQATDATEKVTSVESSFSAALDKVPPREYDNSYEDDEQGSEMKPVTANLTAATVFHSESTQPTVPSHQESSSTTVSTHAVRPGVFPEHSKEITEEKTHLVNGPAAGNSEAEVPFGDVDSTIFNVDAFEQLSDQLSATKGEEKKNGEEGEDTELKLAMETELRSQSTTVARTTTGVELPPLVASTTTESSTESTTTMHHHTDLNEGNSPMSTEMPMTTTEKTPEFSLHHMMHPHEETTTTTQKPASGETPFDTANMHFGDSGEVGTTGEKKEMEEITTQMPVIAHKTPFSFRLPGIDYLEDFSDTESGKFRKLRDQLLPTLRDVFDQILKNFIAVEIVSLDKGSVVVHGMVYTREAIMDLEETAMKLEKALASREMSIGGNEVDPSSITVNGMGTHSMLDRMEKSYESDSSMSFIIAAIITIGVIVIIIISCIIIMLNNRRTVGSIKLKESELAMAENGRHTQYGNVNLMAFHSPPPLVPTGVPHPTLMLHNGDSTSSGRTSSSTTASRHTPVDMESTSQFAPRR